MITFKLFQDLRKDSDTRGKWYARAVTDEVIDLDKLAKHMEKHNTPFSRGTIRGIIIDMVNCIQELALEGKAVKIDDLGIFSLGIITKPADSPKDFDVKKNVKGFRLRCRPTGDMRPQVVGPNIQIQEADMYTVDSSKDGGTAATEDGGDKAQG